MPRGRPNGFGAGPIGTTALCALLALAVPARASADLDDRAPGTVTDPPASVEPAGRGDPAGVWFSLGLLTGTTQFDAGLADYQWDTTPRLGWGIRALAGRGRFATGVRVWSAFSTQAIGDLGAAPQVHATSWELVGEGRLAEVLGTRLLVTAGAGRLRLSYDPDRITIRPPGAVSPIVVDLVPVGAWIGGGGLALRRAVAPDWTVGFGLDARVFAIDTAHRAGDAIVYARESFGDWSARFELAWLVGGD